MSYKTIINHEEITFENAIVSGNEILDTVECVPVEDFDLLKKIKGKEFEPIQYDEKVDLSDPGIEKFIVLPRKKLIFFVDDEEYSTEEIDLTPVDILKIVGLDAKVYYVKQLNKHIEITYKEDEHKRVRMIKCPKFITIRNEPTTVS